MRKLDVWLVVVSMIALMVVGAIRMGDKEDLGVAPLNSSAPSASISSR